jgi:hypothetical protein
MDPNGLDRSTDYPGWTARNLAAHIAASDDIVAMCARALSRGKNLLPIPMPGFLGQWLGNRTNGATIRKYKNADVAALVAVLDAAHAKASSALDQVGPNGWDRPGNVPGLGRYTLVGFLEQMVGHANEHSAELRRAVGS